MKIWFWGMKNISLPQTKILCLKEYIIGRK